VVVFHRWIEFFRNLFSDTAEPELRITAPLGAGQWEGQRLKAAFVSVVCGMPEGIP
jgi:hypothetical protein